MERKKAIVYDLAFVTIQYKDGPTQLLVPVRNLAVSFDSKFLFRVLKGTTRDRYIRSGVHTFSFAADRLGTILAITVQIRPGDSVIITVFPNPTWPRDTVVFRIMSFLCLPIVWSSVVLYLALHWDSSRLTHLLVSIPPLEVVIKKSPLLLACVRSKRFLKALVAVGFTVLYDSAIRAARGAYFCRLCRSCGSPLHATATTIESLRSGGELYGEQ